MSIIAQLAMQNVAIDNRGKKSMLIRSLPESISIISTGAFAQQDMTIESLEVLVRAELSRKKNPHSSQGRKGSLSDEVTAKANLSRARSGPWSSDRPPLGIRKFLRCYWSEKKGHIKRECRKYKAFLQKRRLNGQVSGNGPRGAISFSPRQRSDNTRQHLRPARILLRRITQNLVRQLTIHSVDS